MAQDRGPIPSLLSWWKQTITGGDYNTLAKYPSTVSSGMSLLYYKWTSSRQKLIQKMNNFK